MKENQSFGQVTVALAGNPNAGKTSVFNNLSGSRQHVGNYPGVTVEKKEGRFEYEDHEVTVVDLPGTYSLTAYSIEERIARNFILEEKPQAVVHVVDASNLERNLYLTTQFMELDVPVVIALNMSDVAEARGYSIDIDKLSSLFGVTIVPTLGHRNQGTEELKAAIISVATSAEAHVPRDVGHGKEVERELDHLVGIMQNQTNIADMFPPRWGAIKLLEQDEEVQESLKRNTENADDVLAQADKAVHRIERDYGDAAEILIADRRYGFISGACQEAVRSTVESRHTVSDKIDKVVTNRVLGIPILLGVLYAVFKFTFALSAPLMGWVEAFFGWLGQNVAGFWPTGSESVLKSMLVDGVIGGVGGVLVFLPVILLLFLAISFLEDSGYMARAAFVMDRVMHKIGLHGRSFIPMLLGIGCTVPAIMATRSMSSYRDRITTILVLPLISCGARLPIYALFIPAFFPQTWRAPVLWLIYVVGVVLAIVLAKLLRSTLFRGEIEPFVMELPPYRFPTLKGTVIHMWERSWAFVKKAGTVVVGISIILWALTSFPEAPEEKVSGLSEADQANVQLRHSIAGRVGQGLEPVMKPAGFDWKTNTALIGAFAAKEVFVAQLGIVYALGSVDADSSTLRDKLQDEYTPLQAFSIMLFCLISLPCMMTVAVTWQETRSARWPMLQLFGLTVLAYVVSVTVYQGGLFLGIGT